MEGKTENFLLVKMLYLKYEVLYPMAKARYM
jgi:hypothetical protein